MPIYLYQVLKGDGSRGEFIEIQRPMDVDDPKVHPETGESLVRVYTVPHLGVRYTEGRSRRLLDDKYTESKGFTKYVRDSSSGDYYKASGAHGPDLIRKDSL